MNLAEARAILEVALTDPRGAPLEQKALRVLLNASAPATPKAIGEAAAEIHEEGPAGRRIIDSCVGGAQEPEGASGGIADVPPWQFATVFAAGVRWREGQTR